MSSSTGSEKTMMRIKTYRAEKRTDPCDNKAYTWTSLADWYSRKGWTTKDINKYWEGMELHSVGRTRTQLKEVYPEDHKLAKKRKLDTANGSKWEAW